MLVDSTINRSPGRPTDPAAAFRSGGQCRADPAVTRVTRAFAFYARRDMARRAASGNGMMIVVPVETWRFQACARTSYRLQQEKMGGKEIVNPIDALEDTCATSSRKTYFTRSTTSPPFPLGDDVLVVAFYASAELGCFLALGWPIPTRVLDLFTEFRCLTNGLPVPCGSGLLGAMTYFGLGSIAATEKDEMRALALRGGSYTPEERHALLDYCESDVLALDRLLPRMAQNIDLPRALLRGRYMSAAARIERASRLTSYPWPASGRNGRGFRTG
jgi:hypothetical protein